MAEQRVKKQIPKSIFYKFITFEIREKKRKIFLKPGEKGLLIFRTASIFIYGLNMEKVALLNLFTIKQLPVVDLTYYSKKLVMKSFSCRILQSQISKCQLVLLQNPPEMKHQHHYTSQSQLKVGLLPHPLLHKTVTETFHRQTALKKTSQR